MNFVDLTNKTIQKKICEKIVALSQFGKPKPVRTYAMSTSSGHGGLTSKQKNS